MGGCEKEILVFRATHLGVPFFVFKAHYRFHHLKNQVSRPDGENPCGLRLLRKVLRSIGGIELGTAKLLTKSAWDLGDMGLEQKVLHIECPLGKP